MKATIKDKKCESTITIKDIESIKYRGDKINILLYTGMEIILPDERYIVKEIKDENNTQSSNH